MNERLGKSLGLSYLLIAVLCACHMRQQASSLSPASEPRTPQMTTPQQPETPEVNPLIVGLTGGLPRGLEAWQRFSADGRYRIARASDFNFSEDAMRDGDGD